MRTIKFKSLDINNIIISIGDFVHVCSQELSQFFSIKGKHIPHQLHCRTSGEEVKLIIAPMASLGPLLLCFIVLSAALSHSHAQLTPNFYNKVCPKALSTIKSVVKNAIRREPRMGASLLRLHFHDCFVNVSSLCWSHWLFCLNHTQ